MSAVTKLRVPRSPGTAERLLTLDEAAAYLRIAAGTLKHWALKGRIDYAKVGKSMRFTQQMLDDYVGSQTVSIKVELP